MLNLRRGGRHTVRKIALLASAAVAVVALFLYRSLLPTAGLREATWESVLGLPNAQGDCLGEVQYRDLTGDGLEEALVLVRQGCGDLSTALWLYGSVDGRRIPLWGSPEGPALVFQQGTASLTPEGSILVRDADPVSPLNRAGLAPRPQADRSSLYSQGPEGFTIKETWRDPVLMGQVADTGGCLNVRVGAGTAHPVSGCIPDGQSLVLTEGPQEVAGVQWWAKAGGGWVSGEYLRLSAGPNPDRPPPPSEPRP